MTPSGMMTGLSTPSADLDLIKIGEARKSLVGVKLDQVILQVEAAFKTTVTHSRERLNLTALHTYRRCESLIKEHTDLYSNFFSRFYIYLDD